MGVVSPIFTYYCVSKESLAEHSLWELIGVRLPGLFMASTVPLLLTMFLFLGPLVVKSQSKTLVVWLSKDFWLENLTSIYSLRDHVIAPLSEEITFRASLIPLLVQCVSPLKAVFISPMFFGVAHLHHIVGLVQMGVPFKRAALISAFQFSYTTLFGAYSAFLFLRTGHFVAPFLAHAFCNVMGFPDFGDVLTYPEPKRSLTFGLFVVGFVSWCFLLGPLTNPLLYSNNLYWKSCSS